MTEPQHPGVILVRDNWAGRGYRLYEARSADERFITPAGEAVYRTVRAAMAAARRRFPDREVVRDR